MSGEHPHPSDEPRRPLTPGEARFLFFFAALFFGILAMELLRDFQPIKLAVVFFLLAWLPLTALHEIGHALMARLWGWSVPLMVVGFGPKLLNVRIGHTLLELRRIPISGFVRPIPPPGARRIRLALALIYLAGPGIEVAAAAWLAYMTGLGALPADPATVPLIAAQAFVAAALVGAVINLLPVAAPDGAWSDGLGALLCPFLRADQLPAADRE